MSILDIYNYYAHLSKQILPIVMKTHVDKSIIYFNLSTNQAIIPFGKLGEK
jgi:hypothetical protein